MNRYKLGTLVLLLAAAAVVAGPIKQWNGTEVITYTDLNSNFAHLHASAGHNHGPVIVNGDINASAAISHSKLATPHLLPKTWAQVACSGSCSVTEMSPAAVIGSVTWSSAGIYVVNLAVPRTDGNYLVLVNSNNTASDAVCHGWASNSSTVSVRCTKASDATALESNFSLLIMDAN